MHAKTIPVQSHGRNSLPCKRIGITSPDLILHRRSDPCSVSDLKKLITNRSLSRHSQNISSDQLPGQIYIHIKTMRSKLTLMNSDIIPAAQQALLLSTKPHKLHSPARSVLPKISAKLHDDRRSGHIIIGPRSLRYRIIMRRKR